MDFHIMSDFQKFFNLWRWCVYNRIDIHDVNTLNGVNKSFDINSLDWHYNPFSNMKEKYSSIINNNLRQKKFDVEENQIKEYDSQIKEESLQFYSEHNFYPRGNFYIRSIFIENCLILVNNYNRKELIEKIKSTLVYYHWWDAMSLLDLSNTLTKGYFLSSTCKLIKNEDLFNYINFRFDSKEEFISHLLMNFTPSDFAINEMNNVYRASIIFDYDWLFLNELNKSIRVFENECRLEFNQKIVGSFFNENLLFKEIKEVFGNKFDVISQGCPEWLKPQRFDIYFPNLNIAIEYQGAQHFRPVDFGGKGKKIAKKQYKKNLERDAAKNEKAKLNNCALIYVYPNYKLKEVLKEIENEICKKHPI